MRLPIYLLWLLTFLLCSCYFIPEKRESIANKITLETIEQLEKKGLTCLGTGGKMMNDIKIMHIYFGYKNPLNLKEARSLILDCLETYLLSINSNKEIRPYLHNFPFTHKNVSIMISCRDDKGDRFLPDYITLMHTSELGNICYYVDAGNYQTRLLHEELYEDALKIVKEGRDSEK